MARGHFRQALEAKFEPKGKVGPLGWTSILGVNFDP
jgi:hypothetical protein